MSKLVLSLMLVFGMTMPAISFGWVCGCGYKFTNWTFCGWKCGECYSCLHDESSELPLYSSDNRSIDNMEESTQLNMFNEYITIK